MDELGAFELDPQSKDAVALLDLPSGAYTGHITGVGGATGVALMEIYDADGEDATANLVNISNRGFVGQDSNVQIPGFVIRGSEAKQYLIRGVGTSLLTLDPNLTGLLQDPKLALYSGQTLLYSNDDLAGSPDEASIIATANEIGAFPLVTTSNDAALLVTLEPGAYTAILSGVGGTTGVALAEVYEVPSDE